MFKPLLWTIRPCFFLNITPHILKKIFFNFTTGDWIQTLKSEIYNSEKSLLLTLTTMIKLTFPEVPKYFKKNRDKKKLVSETYFIKIWREKSFFQFICWTSVRLDELRKSEARSRLKACNHGPYFSYRTPPPDPFRP